MGRVEMGMDPGTDFADRWVRVSLAFFWAVVFKGPMFRTNPIEFSSLATERLVFFVELDAECFKKPEAIFWIMG